MEPKELYCAVSSPCVARSVARSKPAFYISVIGVLFVLNVRRTTILVWFLVASLGVKKKKNDDDGFE